jgi:hypothetical protein
VCGVFTKKMLCHPIVFCQIAADGRTDCGKVTGMAKSARPTGCCAVSSPAKPRRPRTTIIEPSHARRLWPRFVVRLTLEAFDAAAQS